MTVPGESNQTPNPIDPMDFGATSSESGPFWTTGEALPEPDQSVSSEPHNDSHPVAEGTQSEDPGPEEEEVPEFDPKYREAFIGLTFVGKRPMEFSWMGHKFKIRTLLTDELIEVGMVHAKYQGTVSDVKAYQSAVVGICTESVDGQSLPIPIMKGTDLVEERFHYVTRHWHPWTIDAVYEKYLELEAEVVEIIGAMVKASGSAR